MVLREEHESTSWMSEGTGGTRNSLNFRQRVEPIRRTWDLGWL